jgi:UDP-glucuronate decarboxylase
MIEDLQRIHAAARASEKFRGATVVVTGCAGFLGFYIMQYLARFSGELGLRRVIGLDSFLLGAPAWTGALARDFPDVVEIRQFDISKNQLADIKGAAEAAFVVHGASVASPTFYRRYPIETIDANIWGLRNLLDFYRHRASLRGLLFFSSSEIYGDPDEASIPTDESYRGNVACVGPRACYDESKRFGETLCYVYGKIYGMPITVARPFNNYGPGMLLHDRRLPADFAKCVVEGRDIVILSDGTPTRTFCYVSDAVTGYLKCLLFGAYDCFNIGIERPEVQVKALAEMYRQAGNEIFAYTGRVRYQVSGDEDYLVDNPSRRSPVITKARQKLDYNPKVLVEEGIRRYLAYLRNEGE